MKIRKLLSTAAVILIFSGFFNFANAQVAIDIFDLNPKVVPTASSRTNFQMTLNGTIDVSQFNSDCGSNANEFSWYVYKYNPFPAFDTQQASGNHPINRTSAILNFNINRTVTINTTGSEISGSAQYYASIYCPAAGPLSSSLAESDRVQIIFGLGNTNFACVAGDNRYACSPLNFENCSDVSACSGRQCIRIASNLCGQDVPLPPPGGPVPGPGPGGPIPGEDVEVELNIPNPIAAKSLVDLAKAIGRFLFQIAIPIAVIIIIYAGLLYLTSGGKPEQVKKATTALKYALIGLAIILIGQGFFTLIKSILDLGGPGT